MSMVSIATSGKAETAKRQLSVASASNAAREIVSASNMAM